MSETQTRSVTSARRDPTIPRCGPTTSHEDDVEIDSADEDSFLVLFGEVELTSPERRLDDIDPFDTATMTIPIDALTAGLPMEEAIEMTGSHSIPPEMLTKRPRALQPMAPSTTRSPRRKPRPAREQQQAVRRPQPSQHGLEPSDEDRAVLAAAREILRRTSRPEDRALKRAISAPNTPPIQRPAKPRARPAPPKRKPTKPAPKPTRPRPTPPRLRTADPQTHDPLRPFTPRGGPIVTLDEDAITAMPTPGPTTAGTTIDETHDDGTEATEGTLWWWPVVQALRARAPVRTISPMTDPPRNTTLDEVSPDEILPLTNTSTRSDDARFELSADAMLIGVLVCAGSVIALSVLL